MPAPPLSNSFEGGTNGAVITVANSGGASGDAFTTIGGSLATFSSTHAAHGLLSAYSGVATSNVSTQWSGLGSLTSITYFRMYTWLVSLPTANISLIRFDIVGGGECGGLGISPSGTLLARDAANNNIGAGSVVVPTGQWIRLEAAVIPGASANGSIEWRLFLTPDSTTADEDLTHSGATLGANIDGVRFGSPQGSGTVELYWDDVSVSSVGWIGPVSAVSLQHQYPNTDISTTGWTPTPSSPTTLWDKLDETSPSDTDYIQATAS